MYLQPNTSELQMHIFILVVIAGDLALLKCAFQNKVPQ